MLDFNNKKKFKKKPIIICYNILKNCYGGQWSIGVQIIKGSGSVQPFHLPLSTKLASVRPCGKLTGCSNPIVASYMENY